MAAEQLKEQASAAKRIHDCLADDPNHPSDDTLPKRPAIQPLQPPEAPIDLATVIANLAKSQEVQNAQMLEFQRQSAATSSVLQQLVGAVANLACVGQVAPALQQPAPATPAVVLASPSLPSASIAMQDTPIPDSLNKIIVQRTRSFKEAVFRLARARVQLSTLEADSQIFGKPGSEYPKKCKPFKSSTTFAELDSPFTEACSSDHAFSVCIPTGTSRRDAMALVHRASSAFLVQCQYEAQQELLSSLEPLANPTVLRSLVTDVITEAAKPELAQHFGLPKPINGTISESTVQARVDTIYASIYVSLNKKLENDKAASDKSKELQQSLAEDLTKSSPDEILNQLLDRRLDAKFQQAGLSTGPEGGAMTDEPEVAVSAGDFVRSLPGNGSSPLDGVGHSKTTERASRPTPKWKARPLGKGKGNTAGRAKGAGKDKGKDKSKPVSTQNRSPQQQSGKGRGSGKACTTSGKGAGKKGKGKGK